MPFDALRRLPPEDLAANWQKVVAFLSVAFEAWPAYLAERGLADAAALRNLRLRRQAGAAPLIFGDRPVIAAGSTGSIPATADLLAAVADLPRGAIVLPGLDTSLTPEQHAALLVDDANPHGHPQYGLARLLRRLGAGPGEVVELAEAPAPRTAVVRRAAARRRHAHWTAARAALAPDLAAAAEGLEVVAAPPPTLRRAPCALRPRRALPSRPHRGIVTPDQTWAAASPPSSSASASRSTIRRGRRSSCRPLAASPASSSPSTKRLRLGGARRAAAQRARRRSACACRGCPPRRPPRARPAARPAPGPASPACARRWRSTAPRAGAARCSSPRTAAVAGLLDRIEAALAPLAEPPRTAAAFARALLDAVRAVTVPAPQTPPAALLGAEELAAWAEDLAAHPGQGPALPATGLDNVLYALMRGHTVRNPERRRDDIFIWGLLEARLQAPDLLVLAGLNEDIWPEAADPGPWLSRGMRLALGLSRPSAARARPPTISRWRSATRVACWPSPSAWARRRPCRPACCSGSRPLSARR